MTWFAQNYRFGGDALKEPKIELVTTKDGRVIPLRPTVHGEDDWDGDNQALEFGFWITEFGELIPMSLEKNHPV